MTGRIVILPADADAHAAIVTAGHDARGAQGVLQRTAQRQGTDSPAYTDALHAYRLACVAFTEAVLAAAVVDDAGQQHDAPST